MKNGPLARGRVSSPILPYLAPAINSTQPTFVLPEFYFIFEVQLTALMTGLVIKLLMEYFFTISEYLMYCVNIMAARIRVNCRLLRSAGNILSENILIALRALHTFQA